MYTGPITVVLPTRNIARFLPDALASIEGQQGDWRLVAVDSASTDGTRALLQAFAERHPQRVQVIDDARARLSEAVNLGIVAAEPGWIQWIGGDDQVAPGAHEQVRALLGRNPAAEWLLGDIQFLAEDGTPGRRGRVQGWNKQQLLLANNLYAPSTLYTRDLAIRAGLMSPVLRRNMDYEFWFRLAWLTQPVEVGEVLAMFRVRNDALSGGLFAAEALRESLGIRQLYAAYTARDQAIIGKVFAGKYLPALAKRELRPLWLKIKALRG